MANNNLAEALARIEHKVDLMLDGLAQNTPGLVLTSVGDPSHICPLCQQNVVYEVNLQEQQLRRGCGCSTGMQAPVNLGFFSPPTTENNGNGSTEE